MWVNGGKRKPENGNKLRNNNIHDYRSQYILFLYLSISMGFVQWGHMGKGIGQLMYRLGERRLKLNGITGKSPLLVYYRNKYIGESLNYFLSFKLVHVVNFVQMNSS